MRPHGKAINHGTQWYTNKNSANGEGHGTDFVLQEGNKGALVIGEIDYLRNQKSTDTGKPGQYAIGVLHNNNSFPTLPDGQAQSNSYSGVYVMGQQMIYRPSAPGTAQGLTAWGTYTFNSKPLVNPMPAFLGAGQAMKESSPRDRKTLFPLAGSMARSAKKFQTQAQSSWWK